jgi:hypothetical protein
MYKNLISYFILSVAIFSFVNAEAREVYGIFICVCVSVCLWPMLRVHLKKLQYLHIIRISYSINVVLSSCYFDLSVL